MMVPSWSCGSPWRPRGARAARARASRAALGSGRRGSRPGSAAARAPSDDPRPGTASERGPRERPPAAVRPSGPTPARAVPARPAPRGTGALPQQFHLHRQLPNVTLGRVQRRDRRFPSLILQPKLETGQAPPRPRRRRALQSPSGLPPSAPTQVPSRSLTEPCSPPPWTSDSPLIRVQENRGRLIGH